MSHDHWHGGGCAIQAKLLIIEAVEPYLHGTGRHTDIALGVNDAVSGFALRAMSASRSMAFRGTARPRLGRLRKGGFLAHRSLLEERR